MFVADGYGNRRVIVFDAETGAYKRHWGAYGKKPNDDKQAAYDPARAAVQQFANPVHCAKPSQRRPGLCLRPHQQPHPGVQEGRHLRDRMVLSTSRPWAPARSGTWTSGPTPTRRWLLNIDGENNLVRILQRSDGKVVGSFGRSGRQAGNFHWVHSIAVDSKGNIYTGEVDNGKRVQKFKPDRTP